MNQIMVTLLKDAPELKAGSIYRTYTEKEFYERCEDKFYYDPNAVYCFHSDLPNTRQYPETTTEFLHDCVDLVHVLMSIANKDGWYKLDIVQINPNNDKLLLSI